MRKQINFVRKLKQSKMLYLMLLPSLLYFSVFIYFSIVNGTIISFQNFRFVGKSEFVGLKNYLEIFSTPGFWRVFKNTVILSSGNIILTTVVPMALALFINDISFSLWKRFLQTVVYLPYLFSWVIAGGIWIFLLSPDVGLINVFRTLLGMNPIYFLTIEAYARPILIGVNLWKQAGFVCILYLAAIAGINPELYEAAIIDGAGGFKKTLYITIPQLLDTLKIVLLLNVMGAFQLFDQVYVMRNEMIAQKIDVLMYYVYIKGLEQFEMGYAAAISVVIFISTLISTLIIKRVIKYSV